MTRPSGVQGVGQGGLGGSNSTNLGEILERVLDRGIVIAGDIRVNLLDIELLTLKLRLVIASVDTAREIGIDWWEHDPWLNSRAARQIESARGDGPQLKGESPQRIGSQPERRGESDEFDH